MQRTALILVLAMVLSPVCIAETSSTERFLSSLSQTWDSFLDMAGDAGNSVLDWVEESGVQEWVDDRLDHLSAWAEENGLTDWARGTLDKLTSWFDESGIKEWASETSRDFRAFVDENRPAIEAWLDEAGEEVQRAWDTLLNAGQHTSEEIRQAYDTVAESLDAAGR